MVFCEVCTVLSIHVHVFTGLHVYALCRNFWIGCINNNIKYGDTVLGFYIFEPKLSLIIHIFSFLDFKLPLCCEIFIPSFG
jgi:hypothetical protein